MPSIREFLRENAKLRTRSRPSPRKVGDDPRRGYASIAMHWMPEILYRFPASARTLDVDLRMVDHELEPF